MTNEWLEYKAYTDTPVFLAGSKQSTAFMGRFSTTIIKKNKGFSRIFTILARGYLFHNSDGTLRTDDPYERTEEARCFLYAWCSLPYEVVTNKALKFHTSFPELHSEFPDIVDENGGYVPSGVRCYYNFDDNSYISGGLKIGDEVVSSEMMTGADIVEVTAFPDGRKLFNGNQCEGVEDFLGLLKNAASVVTTSFHAVAFSIIFKRPFNCFAFGKAAEGKKLIVYRLWNQGGADEKNNEILETLETFFPKPWAQERRGIRIGNRVYLEYGDKFDWPDLTAEDMGQKVFCYGLRDQIGVLCDGTVVPCCLDHDGDLALGNLLTQDMEDILNTPRAKAIYNGFAHRQAAEELCRKCGYARRFV